MMNNLPSLENLIEEENLGIESLHPGGLELTQELATLCGIRSGTRVLEIASGTGETACFLKEIFQCKIIGLDASLAMVERARKKALRRGLAIEFRQGDAHQLPFEKENFEVVICECTLCFLQKEKALEEMFRVLLPGGRVGIDDLIWKENAPPSLKKRLEELENERPETLEGWKTLLEKIGFIGVKTVDVSPMFSLWMKESKRKIGWRGQARIFWRILKKWGIHGLTQIWASQKLFQNPLLGYALMVGKKP